MIKIIISIIIKNSFYLIFLEWKMDLVKKILTIILSLLFLSTTIMPNLCPAIEPPSPLTDFCPSFSELDQGHHQHPMCYKGSRSPCQNKCSCCNLVPQSTISSYFFILDFCYLTPAEIFIQFTGITKSLYHPPRSLL